MKFIFLSLFILTGCVAKNQPGTSLFSRDYLILTDGIQLMEVDPLGNIFLVDATDRLTRFDTTGQQLFNVVNNNLGQIHSIDVGNPFKILIFYRDQQTILICDNTLSEIQRITLGQWGFQDVTAVCLSSDNAVWLFNGLKKELIKMSDTGEPILISDPFDILQPPSSRPDFIYDIDHLLLLKETGQPIAVFNDFGNYLHPLIVEDELFSISNDKLVIHKNGSVSLYNIQKREDDIFYELQQPWIDKKVFLVANQFYVFDNKGVFLITPKSPKGDP